MEIYFLTFKCETFGNQIGLRFQSFFLKVKHGAQFGSTTDLCGVPHFTGRVLLLMSSFTFSCGDVFVSYDYNSLHFYVIQILGHARFNANILVILNIVETTIFENWCNQTVL